MYNFNPKKYIAKNIIYTVIIILIAVISTYKIYYKFQDDRDINYSSESFVVTFHEKSGDKMSITNVTPVTDSVGLSSTAYNLNIKNNQTVAVPFRIKIIDDFEKIADDNCQDNLISKNYIRISVKNGKKENQIYNLNELNDGILLDDEIKALENREITVRIWVNKDSNIPMNTDLHYHGIIQVLENNDMVAINK
jgi:hypothetical protein